ncbi:MAG: DUF2452 domain-containing protein [Flavobacteriales bacterium]|nr:DUF2452 domain-containing protein [Flavobacteriales bacterium]
MVIFVGIEMTDKKKDKEFINPIDPDKVAENPHSLEYAHHVGSAIVKAEDQGKMKGRSLTAMEFQTDQQLSQIYDQMKLLAEQAKKIELRKEISERIYKANFRFEPIINHVYYLYETEELEQVLSIIGPGQWGRSKQNNYTYLATVRLLADHTWEIMDSAQENENSVEDI